MRPDGPVRVLLIDSAPLFARGLARELARAGDIQALSCGGAVGDVRECLLRYHPEVIVLDLGLRESDALALLRKLQTHYPVPVIVSSRCSGASASSWVQALRQGALEVVRRPDSGRPEALRAHARDLAVRILTAASAARPVPPPRPALEEPMPFRRVGLRADHYLVAIGASTGGTRALETLLSRVPADFPPIVIVQHMPAGFTRSFAERLDSTSAASVGEAAEGEPLSPGRAVIARGDTHLVVRRGAGRWITHYTDQRPVNRHCPSVDVLFASVAEGAGPRAVGVLLTGMGEDGARGLLAMRRAGALTMAQTRESCVVYGMPRAAIEMGAAQHSAAPEDVAGRLTDLLKQTCRGRIATTSSAGSAGR